ncbi:hypothetical protein DL93DRAFT_1101779 [Clavulina sp. PMI_390]|nr:hypothetical protein DL93DRAFT_1101779 [Clavulina sp. PMI_390]
MGLGKTIQSLTRITEGKPSKEDLKKAKLSKTNLIICPVSVLPQWAEEIEKMTEGLLVVRHHGPSRTTNPEILKRADVVITTYSTLTSEHKVHTGSAGRDASKKKAAEEEKKKEEESDSDDSLIGRSLPKKKIAPKRATKEKPKLSALFQVGFWRIFLDEAQNIKNRSSKAALACWALEAKYRWVLTGTPIQNSVDELYPLFRFLKIRPLNDWDNFSSVISKPVKDGRSKNAMKRLHVVLNATMLRRTKNQQINGKPIIVLPPRTVEVIPCDFDEDERSFYTAVEARTSLQMNKFIEKGTVMENYTSVLVLLLRLRQACDHPALLSKDFVKDLDALDAKPASTQGDDDDDDKKEVDDLAGLMDNLGIGNAVKCSICMSELPRGWKGGSECEDCQETVAKVSRRKSLLVHQTKKKNVVLDSDDEAEDSTLPPTSTKIRKMLEILEAIYQRNKGQRDEEGNRIPSEKTIIFSQFTTMLDLCEPFLTDAGIRWTRFDGSMKAEAREEALNKVRNDKKCRVILISFKAGGVGLNLTACNNVILLDLWWNPALEDQAFDRAHRLGQKKSVNIYKLTVVDSVEDRILQLQDQKRELAAAALAGGKLAKAGLNLNDLMMLFRPKRHHADESDDED